MGLSSRADGWFNFSQMEGLVYGVHINDDCLGQRKTIGKISSEKRFKTRQLSVVFPIALSCRKLKHVDHSSSWGGIYWINWNWEGKFKIFHLQYPNYIVFLCSRKAKNLLVIKVICINFELIAGRKVNFDKSSVSRVNISKDRMRILAISKGYKAAEIPFPYLG